MQQTVVDEPLMTFKEVMKQLRVARSTLLRMMERGEIRAYKVGNTWRFFPSDVRSSIKPVVVPAQQGETQQ